MISNSSIDKLGEALRDGKVTVAEVRLLEAYRRTFQDAYESVVGIARIKLHMAVTGRPSKSTGAIVQKLMREKIRLSQMQDIAGCRVIVDDIPSQQRAVMALEVFLGTAQIVDRRDKPSHGYRAVHLIYRDGGRCVEVQVRTVLQHYWAEFSEKVADIVDPGLKYGQGPDRIRQPLASISASIAALEAIELQRATALRQLEREKPVLARAAKKKLNRAERAYQAQRKRMLQTMDSLKRAVS